MALTRVDWTNILRLLAPIGNIPPVKVGDRDYAMLDERKLAAWFKRNGLRQTGGGSNR